MKFGPELLYLKVVVESRWRALRHQGFKGFFSFGTARGMSPSSKSIDGGLFSWPCSFGGSPRRAGGSFGIGILTVATAVLRRRIAPPLPATQALSPP